MNQIFSRREHWPQPRRHIAQCSPYLWLFSSCLTSPTPNYAFTNSSTHLHLLIPTFEDPANQGSRMNIHRNVAAFLKPALRDGLSWSRSPFLNQCTICLGRGSFTLPVILNNLCLSQENTQQNFAHVKQSEHTRCSNTSQSLP